MKDRQPIVTAVDIELTGMLNLSATGEKWKALTSDTGGTTMVMIPWEGRSSACRVRDGMTVPFTGEVAWLWSEGRRAYSRGTVTSLTYEFS